MPLPPFPLFRRNTAACATPACQGRVLPPATTCAPCVLAIQAEAAERLAREANLWRDSVGLSPFPLARDEE